MAQFQPLDINTYEIRILKILPGPPQSAVRCTMERTNLIDPVGYATLSYCWGSAIITEIIYVNGIEIPVTISLAAALHRLRRLGVSRVWADALCINQEDKQEKHIQLRDMKQILYSKADVAYSWLGREEDDGALAAILFLESLLSSDESTALARLPHTCISTTSALYSACQTPSQNAKCPRCIIESHFQALQHLLNHQYWKQRWIMQDVSASYRHAVLCDNTVIDLDGMARAIARCRESEYWSPDTEKAYSWFKIAMTFRRCYQQDAKPSLCQAIEWSRNFESTDPRDAIFSLLAICSDGPDLIPFPNYVQSVETVVIKLTRALIWKHKRLDFILIDGVNPTKSTLPSWAPDWLSVKTPLQVDGLANVTAKGCFCLGDSIDPKLPLGGGKVLRVQGITIGRIARTTSATGSETLALASPSQSDNPVPCSGSSTPFYYASTSQILAALFSCFACTLQNQRTCPSEGRYFCLASIHHRVVWHAFCLHCLRPNINLSQPSPDLGDVDNPEREISQWLWINATFLIQGKTLEGWCKEQDLFLRTMMRVLDSKLAIPFLIFLILLTNAFSVAILVFYLTWPDSSHSMRLAFLISTMISFIASGGLSLEGSTQVFYYRRLINRLKSLFNDSPDLMRPERTLVVADKGFLGMVKGRAKKGDRICYLVGCSEPVVLREVEGDAEGDRGAKHALVGRCYVHLTEADRREYGASDSKKSKSKNDRLKEWTTKGILREMELV